MLPRPAIRSSIGRSAGFFWPGHEVLDHIGEDVRCGSKAFPLTAPIYVCLTRESGNPRRLGGTGFMNTCPSQMALSGPLLRTELWICCEDFNR